ncbi:hypothetical protein [Bacillus subtilis]|uniref:hypothetical protein n=1 Tax=Bacillus subtilis TaxID=1423 RepID=UPI001BA479D4|nr:hypothetical protein [Bacillus subtilis]QUG79140.1 hypothetical protein GSN02_06575 [Bacillus subtilis]ULN55644.1 hypothetical protein MID01_15220 [Bacillus subtilis]WOA21229.1 hypothetical protein RW107_14760 [Bacillus subtilis]
MNNIDRLEERLIKNHKNKLMIHKVMKRLRDGLIKLENRFIDIFEISDNRVEFRTDEDNNEVFYFNLSNREAEFRGIIDKDVPYIQVIDPVNKGVYVVFQINSSEELTPLSPLDFNRTPYNYSIHVDEIVDFVIGVVCFNLEYDTKEMVLQ